MKRRDRAVAAGMARLYETIAGQIRGGALAAGDRLPSERELASAHDINRMAVKAVLDRLVRELLIYRAQGKGTFVRGQVQAGVTVVLGTGELLVGQAGEWRAQVIGYGTATACGDLSALADAPEDPIPAAARVVCDGERPIAVERAYLRQGGEPLPIGELRKRTCLAKGLGGAGMAETVVSVEVLRADAATAALLALDEGAPVFGIRRWYRDAAGTPLACVEQAVRTDGVSLADSGERI